MMDREHPRPAPMEQVLMTDGYSRGATPGPFERLNPYPGDAFNRWFTTDEKSRIVAAVKAGYDVVQERHDESLGFNAQTFGYNVYHIAKHHLAKLGGMTRVEEVGALFRMQGGEYTLGIYKVGHSSETNIWEAFPTSENGANSGTKNEDEPFFPAFATSMLDRVDESRYVVVAHMGNPTDGLVAVYLCIPIRAAGGKITRWGYAEQIYMAGKNLVVPTDVVGPRPPEVQVAPVELKEEPEGDVIVTAKHTT